MPAADKAVSSVNLSLERKPAMVEQGSAHGLSALLNDQPPSRKAGSLRGSDPQQFLSKFPARSH